MDSAAEEEPNPDPPEDIGERRENRKEEARLCGYVKNALMDIYDSEFADVHVPDHESFVMDVHSERPSGDYRNVDLIAVDFRSEDHYELVTVEVKLQFNARLVQQAANYLRFSDRVWIAVVVDCKDPTRAGEVLRSKDPLLFDHILNLGIGILGCRRSRGKSYEVFPIQWPKLKRPSKIEKYHFLEGYREHFERLGILQRRFKKTRSAG